jgi:hypothetical protein
MLNIAVMWSNCHACVMVNKRKLHSAEIVRRVGRRQWLWWMEQQLVWHRRQGEGEENNVEEDPQPGTIAGVVWNWGCQLGRRIVFRPLTGAPINKGSTLFYITQALHPSSGGTKQTCITDSAWTWDRTVLIFPLPEMTMCDMPLFLAVTVQMGHDIRNSLEG